MVSTLRAFLKLTDMSHRSIWLLVLVAMLGGGINVGLVALITAALRRESNVSAWLMGGAFVVAVLAYLWSQDHVQSRLAELMERAAATIRRKIAESLQQASLSCTEALPNHIKHAALGRDVSTMSVALTCLVTFVASMTTVLGCLAYMAALSFVGAAVVTAVIAATVVFYQAGLGRLMRELSGAQQTQDQFFRFSDDLLLGAKELKMDSEWAARFMRDDVFDTLARSADQLGQAKKRQHRVGQLGTVAFLALIGATTFFHQAYGRFDNTLATGFVLALLFLNAPIQSAVAQLPALGAAAVSMQRLQALLDMLARHAESGAAQAEDVPVDWQLMKLTGVSYGYDGPANEGRLALRNVDLEIRRGDVVFLVGGNGSGKTTLAKVVTGLYSATRGSVWLDGRRITAELSESYRSQFAAVFSDAHLFSRSLAEMGERNADRVQRMLDELALVPCRMPDGRFDPRALSQGQKKRLALAFTMSEDKPVLLLDEWTADQDPEFRAYFYEVLLPRWREEGRTIIVISHDDRYFQHASLLVKLDGGCVREVTRRPPARIPEGIRA